MTYPKQSNTHLNDTYQIEKNIIDKFISLRAISQKFYELRIMNGRLEGDELIEKVIDEYLNELSLLCEIRGVSYEQRLEQLRHNLIRHNDEFFNRLKEKVLFKLESYKKPSNHTKHPEPTKPDQYNTNEFETPLAPELAPVEQFTEQQPVWEELTRNKSGIGLFGVEALKKYYNLSSSNPPNNTDELRKWIIANKDELPHYRISGDTMKGGLTINDDKYTNQQLKQSWDKLINKISDTKENI